MQQLRAKWQQRPETPALISRTHTNSSHHTRHQCSDSALEWISKALTGAQRCLLAPQDPHRVLWRCEPSAHLLTALGCAHHPCHGVGCSDARQASALTPWSRPHLSKPASSQAKMESIQRRDIKQTGHHRNHRSQRSQDGHHVNA